MVFSCDGVVGLVSKEVDLAFALAQSLALALALTLALSLRAEVHGVAAVGLRFCVFVVVC